MSVIRDTEDEREARIQQLLRELANAQRAADDARARAARIAKELAELRVTEKKQIVDSISPREHAG